MKRFVLLSVVAALALSLSNAQINIPSDGSDGALNVPTGTGDFFIDLREAVTAQWDTPSPNPGKGVYDPVKWAVVFKYSSINIPANRTVRFINHPSNPPVVWLVQGDVTINGSVNLDGQHGNAVPLGQTPAGGPGGYRGGAFSPGGNLPGSAGFGPGGGVPTTDFYGGSYGTAGYRGGTLYNNAAIVPLIGGSGGAHWSHNGGGGGGAILLGAAGTVIINGSVNANGGSRVLESGGGSGGAIRLIANNLSGGINAAIRAIGGDTTGGNGRIRIEVNQNSYQGVTAPQPSFAPPASPPLIWLPENAPKVRVLTVDNRSVPADPRSSFVGDADLNIGATSAIFRIETENVPGNWRVYVRVVPRNGTAFIVDATRVSGNDTRAIYEASVNVPNGASAVFARAEKP